MPLMLSMLDLLSRARRPDPAKGEEWLPPSVTVPGFDLAGTSLFRYRRGGDYHDIFVPTGCKDGSIAVVVGDVSGHDSRAARLMSMARELLRGQAACPGHLARMMEAVNRELSDRFKAGQFMTLFLAVLVAERKSIHWINAGQGDAIAYDPTMDSFREVGGPDIPLGVDPDWHYTELKHTGWPKGALLVVGTDGVWETRSPSGEMYGTERLCKAIRAASKGSAAQIVTAITRDLVAFRNGSRQTDDLTLVVVKAV